MYNVFGSGANHAIYAQFMAQSALANRGRKVGLLRGAGTRMALWFYAMMRLKSKYLCMYLNLVYVFLTGLPPIDWGLLVFCCGTIIYL